MRKQRDGFSGQRALMLPGAVVQECIRVEPLCAALYITDIGYYPHAQYHFRERTESIRQYILIYCVSGRGWFTLDGVTCSVGPNTFFILPPGSSHAYGADDDDPWTIYWVHYGGVLAGTYGPAENQPVAVPLNLNSRISDRIALFEDVYRALEQGYSRENLLYASAVLHGFLGSLAFFRQHHTSDKTSDRIDLVDAAIHFMRENLENRLTMQEIAAYVGYSPSYFSGLFTSRTGYTPMVYFNQLKIQKACQLLDLTDMQINQICFKVGISDCYYFSRLFRKQMGMSPTEYKQLKKG